MKEIVELSPGQQERLLDRLTHHAWCKMRRLTWRGARVTRGGAVPGGYEPYDFALDAIEKAMDGRRTWNRERYPTLEKFLRSVINSDISTMVESVDNARGRRLAVPSGADDDRDETIGAYEKRGTEPMPADVAMDREWQARFRAAAMKLLEGDAFLVKLFDCLEAEITEPSDIAALLGVSVTDVNNEKKRLRRKLDQLDATLKPPKTGKRS